MKIVDKKDSFFKKENCYPCYSLKLNDFLQEEKKILPIRVTSSKKTGKTCFVYVLTDMLDEALKEWTDRKKNGNLYSPKKGNDNNEV